MENKLKYIKQLESELTAKIAAAEKTQNMINLRESIEAVYQKFNDEQLDPETAAFNEALTKYLSQ